MALIGRSPNFLHYCRMLHNSFLRVMGKQGRASQALVQKHLVRLLSTQNTAPQNEKSDAQKSTKATLTLDADPEVSATRLAGGMTERQRYFIDETGMPEYKPKPPRQLTPEDKSARGKFLTLLVIMAAISAGVYGVKEYRDKQNLPDPMVVPADRPEKYAHLKDHEFRARSRVDKARERRHLQEQERLREEGIATNDEVAAVTSGTTETVPVTQTVAAAASVLPTPKHEHVEAAPAAVEAVPAAVEPVAAAVHVEPETHVAAVEVAEVKETPTPVVDQAAVDAVELWSRAQAKAIIAGHQSLESAEHSIGSLATAITQRISTYEAERQAFLNKLRKNLETGAGGSDRLVALLERRDEDFFRDCARLLEDYTQQALKAAQSASSIAQAQQAVVFANELRTEAKAIQDALQHSFQGQLDAQVDAVRTELTAQYEAQIYRLALEHAKAMDTLTEHYSAVLDELSDKVLSLSVAMDLHNKRRLQSDTLQRLSVALVEAERRVDRGEPLAGPWTDLALLSHADPVLKAAISTVPEHIIRGGAAPVTHLQRRFEAVEDAARSAAYVPPKASFFSHVMGALFGFLTVKEQSLLAVPTIDEEAYPTSSGKDVINEAFFTGIEHDHARLSRAGFFLNRGEVAQVVRELEAIVNPNAKTVCQGFLAQARERLIIDQALGVIRTHSKALYKDMFN